MRSLHTPLVLNICRFLHSLKKRALMSNFKVPDQPEV